MNRRELIFGGLCAPLVANSSTEYRSMPASKHTGNDSHAGAAIALNDFEKALVTDGPSAELTDAGDAFGWLIGGWAGTLQDIDPDGNVRQSEGEWWFSWVLEGRAVQDVLICPSRGKRSTEETGTVNSSSANNRYGATIRWFDRKTQEWRIVWVNPVTGTMNTLAGRRTGDQIILLGTAGGEEIRWRFNEIRSNSFVWRGEEKKEGKWRVSAEFRFRRIL